MLLHPAIRNLTSANKANGGPPTNTHTSNDHPGPADAVAKYTKVIAAITGEITGGLLNCSLHHRLMLLGDPGTSVRTLLSVYSPPHSGHGPRSAKPFRL